MKRLTLSPLLLAALALAFTAGAGLAAVQKASQKGRVFLPKDMILAVGDQLIIDNDDEFTHQVYVDGDGFKFDSGEQDPGKSVTIAFSKAGGFDLLCRIHPKMKLRVTVK